MSVRHQRTRFPWRSIAIVLGVIGLGFGIYNLRAQPGTSSPSPRAKPREPMLRVSALGRLEPDGQMIQLHAPQSMEPPRVEMLLVKEGTKVSAGELVAILDTFDRRVASIREAEARIEVAQAKLRQVQAGSKPAEIAAQEAMVARAEVAYRNAERELQRAETLPGGAISREDLEKRRLEKESTALGLKHAREILASIREVRSVDIALANAEISAAQAQLQKAMSEYEASLVRSLHPGTVLKIHARPGEKVGERGIFEMGNTDQMYAIAEVYEADIARVRPGQKARIRVASLPEELEGEVEYIGNWVGRKVVFNNDPVADTDARVIEVKIRLKPADSARVSGLTNTRIEAIIDVQ